MGLDWLELISMSCFQACDTVQANETQGAEERIVGQELVDGMQRSWEVGIGAALRMSLAHKGGQNRENKGWVHHGKVNFWKKP